MNIYVRKVASEGINHHVEHCIFVPASRVLFSSRCPTFRVSLLSSCLGKQVLGRARAGTEGILALTTTREGAQNLRNYFEIAWKTANAETAVKVAGATAQHCIVIHGESTFLSGEGRNLDYAQECFKGKCGIQQGHQPHHPCLPFERRDKWGRLRSERLLGEGRLCAHGWRCGQARSGHSGQRCTGVGPGSSPSWIWVDARIPREKVSAGGSTALDANGLHSLSRLGTWVQDAKPRSHGSCSSGPGVHRSDGHGQWAHKPQLAPHRIARTAVHHCSEEQGEDLVGTIYPSCSSSLGVGQRGLYEGPRFSSDKDSCCKPGKEPVDSRRHRRPRRRRCSGSFKEEPVEEKEEEVDEGGPWYGVVHGGLGPVDELVAVGQWSPASLPCSSCPERRECIPTASYGREAGGSEDPKAAQEASISGRKTNGLKSSKHPCCSPAAPPGIDVELEGEKVPAEIRCIELVRAVLQTSRLPGSFQHFARRNLEYARNVDGSCKPRSDVWPCPPPLWRKCWTGMRSLSPRRRKKYRLLETKALCLQGVIVALNWLSLGHAVSPPEYAKPGYPMSLQQQEMVERLEDLVDYYLSAGVASLAELGRAGEKLTKLSSIAFSVHDHSPESMSVDDVHSFLQAIQTSFDSYSNPPHKPSKTRENVPASADVSNLDGAVPVSPEIRIQSDTCTAMPVVANCWCWWTCSLWCSWCPLWHPCHWLGGKVHPVNAEFHPLPEVLWSSRAVGGTLLSPRYMLTKVPGVVLSDYYCNGYPFTPKMADRPYNQYGPHLYSEARWDQLCTWLTGNSEFRIQLAGHKQALRDHMGYSQEASDPSAKARRTAPPPGAGSSSSAAGSSWHSRPPRSPSPYGWSYGWWQCLIIDRSIQTPPPPPPWN